MSDPGNDPVPHPPYDELRSAAGANPEAAKSVEALHAELHAPTPNPEAVRKNVSLLRGIPVLEARIANWWDDPNTQRWMLLITDQGL
jgi:hypothetical protein